MEREVVHWWAVWLVVTRSGWSSSLVNTSCRESTQQLGFFFFLSLYVTFHCSLDCASAAFDWTSPWSNLWYFRQLFRTVDHLLLELLWQKGFLSPASLYLNHSWNLINVLLSLISWDYIYFFKDTLLILLNYEIWFHTFQPQWENTHTY